LAHRRLVGGIARGAGVAGEIELQQVDALAREQPAHAADLLGAVGDPAERRRLVVRQVQHVRVAETAGDGDLRTVGEQPRPGHAGGGTAPGVTSVMRLASTRTAPANGALPLPSRTLAFVIR